MLFRFGNRYSRCCCFILIFFVLVAAAAPVVSPWPPNKQVLKMRLLPPCWLEGGSSQYLLGTDQLGRDMLSRIIYGSQVSMTVGILAVVLSGFMGLALGLTSGYYRGIDQIAMRIADIQLAFPTILLALAVVAVVGGGFWKLVLVLGITNWVPYARVVRSEVLSVKERDFVIAARTVGAGDGRILFRHILPNVIAPFITIATFQVAAAIIAESTLSFLGLGIPANVPSWGNMLSPGQLYVENAWWLSVFPGLAIMIVVTAINVLGDALREHFDPHIVVE